jgi:hypothetical protein
MSVSDVDHLRHRGAILRDEFPRKSGFVFSFKKYSKINANTETLLQRTIEACVHGITKSDYIHVEVIPVIRPPPNTDEYIEVAPSTFTAFAMQGFTENLTENCMGVRLLRCLYAHA